MNHKDNHIITKYITSMLRNQGKLNFSNADKTISHDQLTRAMSKQYQWQTLLLVFLTPFLLVMGVQIIIDDTIIEKPHSKANNEKGSFVRWIYSHKENEVIKGIQFVMIMLVFGNLRIPIGMQIYDGCKSKIDITLELLSHVRNKYKLKNCHVLFDTWYSSLKILKRIDSYGWCFVCRVKKNRKVNDTPVKYLFSNPYNMLEGKIASLKIILVRNRKHYIICNRLSYAKIKIIEHYAVRGKIEETFKILKNCFSLKSCQSRLKFTWENHIYCSIFCFIVSEFKIQGMGISIYKASSKFILRDYRRYLDRWKRILRSA